MASCNGKHINSGNYVIMSSIFFSNKETLHTEKGIVSQTMAVAVVAQ